MNDRNVMLIEEFEAAIDWQAQHASENGAECTARIVRALPKIRESNTELGRRMAAWAGLTLKDAMPLRVAGGLHHLVLTGTDTRLRAVYSGELTNQEAVDAIILDLAETYDAQLAPWLDGPPQTNEAGRSASIMAGLLWLARRVVPRFELFEIGASAGVNTMLDRYRYRLGSTEVGPSDSPMHIAPEWRGTGSPPAPSDEFAIVKVRGCDVATINLGNPENAMRLKAYVWPDAPQRMERIDAAISLAKANPPDLVQMDAAEFAKLCLAGSQKSGVTRAMFHSIMWQYMPTDTQDAITAAFEIAGEQATRDKPLAWISLETDPATFRHELKVRYWDGEEGHGEPVLLAHAHPHGAWVEWSGTD
ncbi:MAG: DUF2332 domain-containing protein [Pseudomonadota bacterium]